MTSSRPEIRITTHQLIGFSLITSASSLMPSMSVFLGQLTIGTGSSGSIVEVLMCMASLGCYHPLAPPPF